MKSEGMGMMQDMMKRMGAMPDMCMKMMEQMADPVTKTEITTSFTTPEIRGLFEEWVKILEEEIVAFVKEKEKTSLSDISAKLKISKKSTLFFIGKLAREGKLTLGEISVAG